MHLNVTTLTLYLINAKINSKATKAAISNYFHLRFEYDIPGSYYLWRYSALSLAE